ncbi:MAG TPA: hypothetical protein VFO27_17890 [Bryobacteraceae bacterium]|nr:hypothetical protein [Bryobacteraceae bacterium]
MRLRSILLVMTLAASIGAWPALAQHGHGGGAMATHGDMDHGQSSHMQTESHMPLTSTTAASRLASHPGLSARLQSLLPAGTDMQTAAAGFKNLGQFVAAVHVSHNLGIPFDQLKAKMTGTSPESLGRAIEDLRPSLTGKTVKTDVKTAEHEAKADLEATEQS